mmetsp:Transcript_93480/g.261469  ORF Transcript_93480/g.261469 Transcript_93480/m.261469 type:complete len:215 (+) Transcript_93480:3414-4058(+)
MASVESKHVESRLPTIDSDCWRVWKTTPLWIARSFVDCLADYYSCGLGGHQRLLLRWAFHHHPSACHRRLRRRQDFLLPVPPPLEGAAPPPYRPRILRTLPFLPTRPKSPKDSHRNHHRPHRLDLRQRSTFCDDAILLPRQPDRLLPQQPRKHRPVQLLKQRRLLHPPGSRRARRFRLVQLLLCSDDCPFPSWPPHRPLRLHYDSPPPRSSSYL